MGVNNIEVNSSSGLAVVMQKPEETMINNVGDPRLTRNLLLLTGLSITQMNVDWGRLGVEAGAGAIIGALASGLLDKRGVACGIRVIGGVFGAIAVPLVAEQIIKFVGENKESFEMLAFGACTFGTLCATGLVMEFLFGNHQN